MHWQSAINSALLYLLENNMVNTLCIEGAFLDALNSPLKKSSVSYGAVRIFWIRSWDVETKPYIILIDHSIIVQ